MQRSICVLVRTAAWAKSNYITDANQLTISHGSDIENVVTGSGNDTVIGTHLDNVIETGSGSDVIYAGGGADIIKSGNGADRIDLSSLCNRWIPLF